jgi:hypothetical protein
VHPSSPNVSFWITKCFFNNLPPLGGRLFFYIKFLLAKQSSVQATREEKRAKGEFEIIPEGDTIKNYYTKLK